jgi:hypothetical protein
VSDFESAASWSVNYNGMPYDDARQIDGVWWYRSQVGNRKILCFLLQDRIVPLFENPTLPRDPDSATNRDAPDELNTDREEHGC